MVDFTLKMTPKQSDPQQWFKGEAYGGLESGGLEPGGLESGDLEPGGLESGSLEPGGL